MLESIAKKFNGISDLIIDKVDFENNGINRKTSLALAAGVILGVRYLKARDGNERREVLTRDSITVSSMFCGIPILKKIYGYILPKINGFKVTTGSGIIGTNLLDSAQLQGWYSINVKKEGKTALIDLCENLANMGGDLGKIFRAGEEKLQVALKDITGSKSGLDNPKIIEKIKAASSNDSINVIVDCLKSENNKILRKAKALKAFPEAIFILSMIGTLGWLLPWYNIKNTKKIMAQKLNNNETSRNKH
jgi:hypothetical protein